MGGDAWRRFADSALIDGVVGICHRHADARLDGSLGHIDPAC